MLDEYENTHVESEAGGCSMTKLNMLFTGSSSARRLQRSIVETCGASNFDVLLERVGDVVGGMVEDARGLDLEDN